MKRFLTICGMAAALGLSAGNLLAQNEGAGQPGSGNRGQGNREQNGGGNRGNFDPAQFQQQMMDRYRERLGFTNEVEWNAVQPLVQKVVDARREVGFGGGGGFGRRAGGGDAGGGGRRGGDSSPEAEALQQAIENNAPAGQIKSALEKYRASRKDKQEKLEQAQSNLRKVLSTKQEAQATLLGLVQ